MQGAWVEFRAENPILNNSDYPIQSNPFLFGLDWIRNSDQKWIRIGLDFEVTLLGNNEMFERFAGTFQVGPNFSEFPVFSCSLISHKLI